MEVPGLTAESVERMETVENDNNEAKASEDTGNQLSTTCSSSAEDSKEEQGKHLCGEILRLRGQVSRLNR